MKKKTTIRKKKSEVKHEINLHFKMMTLSIFFMHNSEVTRVKLQTLKFSLTTGLFLNGAVRCAAAIIRHSPVIASPFGMLLNPHQLFHSSRSSSGSNNVWPSSSFVIAARCLPVQVYGERCAACFSAAISGRAFGLSPSTLLSTLSHRQWLSFICYYYIRLAKKKTLYAFFFLFIGKIDVTAPVPIHSFYWLRNNIFISL